METITRRELMKAVGMSTIALSLGVPTIQGRNRAFRFVFMPCIHFRPDYKSPEGLAAALKAVNAFDIKPDFLITGGDVCHDLRSLQPDAATKRLEDFKTVWSDNTDIKVYHALGNHEVPGWSNSVGIALDHPEGGYRIPIKSLGMPALSYAFEHKGWRIVVAHNVVQTTPGGHTGLYSDEVLALVKNELAKDAKKPTVIVSHIPTVTVTEFFGGRAQYGDTNVSLANGRMTSNPQAFLEAIKTGDVPLCLSGHIHRVDDIRFNGVRFVCSGAVSAQQWMRPAFETMPGFGIVDCYDDGTADYEYRNFGWVF